MFARPLCRNKNKDIEGQCRPSEVVESASKSTFKPLVDLFLKWYEEILVLFRAFAVSLDPLFFYVPVIKEDKKCIWVKRSAVDHSYCFAIGHRCRLPSAFGSEILQGARVEGKYHRSGKRSKALMVHVQRSSYSAYSTGNGDFSYIVSWKNNIFAYFSSNLELTKKTLYIYIYIYTHTSSFSFFLF